MILLDRVGILVWSQIVNRNWNARKVSLQRHLTVVEIRGESLRFLTLIDQWVRTRLMMPEITDKVYLPQLLWKRPAVPRSHVLQVDVRSRQGLRQELGGSNQSHQHPLSERLVRIQLNPAKITRDGIALEQIHRFLLTANKAIHKSIRPFLANPQNHQLLLVLHERRQIAMQWWISHDDMFPW